MGDSRPGDGSALRGGIWRGLRSLPILLLFHRRGWRTLSRGEADLADNPPPGGCCRGGGPSTRIGCPLPVHAHAHALDLS